MAKQLTGLGKGLDALFQNSGVNPLTHKSNDSTVNEIALSKIVPNPLQPRTLFNQEAIDELAQSVSKLGIIQPITVRDQGDGTYMIISGERRYKASLQLGLTTIPAYVRKADDQQLLEMALVENIQRENLNAVEIALTFERLLKDCNLTQEQLSERVGKKRSTISNYVRLLNLPAEVQAALQQGLLSMGHARALASLAGESDQIYMLEQIVEHQLSVRETEEMVARFENQEVQQAKMESAKAAKPEEFKTIGKQLSKLFNRRVSISQNNRGVGKITIKFENVEQLEEIKSVILGNK